MFILTQKQTITWPVTWRAPREGGSFDEHKFKAEYNLLPQSQLDDMIARAQAGARGELERGEAAGLDREVLDEVFVTWHEVKNPDRTDFEDTPANRETFLNLPGMRATLVAGFFETLGGAAERKNSKPPRSTG